jgi:N-acetylneuraminic acid mutarotase
MTKRSFLALLILFPAVASYVACKKQIDCTTCRIGNLQPIADAGRDTIVWLPRESVTLEGANSTDPDNNIVGYYWRNISGPSLPQIANANAVQTVASGLGKGVYQFELTVTDAAGLFSKDTVQITVASQGYACNIDGRPEIHARLIPFGKLSIGKVDMITATANNKILFAGGLSYDADGTGIPIRRVDIYDINTNSWSIKDLAEYPTWRVDMGMAAVDNKIFIAGGGFWGDDIYTNQVDIYNVSDNRWSTASLGEYKSAVGSVSSGNKIFFAGGYSFDGSSNYWSNSVDIYDNATNRWTTGSLSEGRGYVSAVAGGNKIYFAGGQKNNGQFLLSDRIDEYDMVTDSWSTSSLHEPLVGIGVVSADNKVFFAGGQSLSGELGTVEIRDIVTGASSFDCIIPRAGLTAVSKDEKIIFFTGTGRDPRNGTHFEIYDPSSGVWSTGVLDKSITRAAVISVNNVVYVAGGYVNGVGSDQVWKLEF